MKKAPLQVRPSMSVSNTGDTCHRLNFGCFVQGLENLECFTSIFYHLQNVPSPKNSIGLFIPFYALHIFCANFIPHLILYSIYDCIFLKLIMRLRCNENADFHSRIDIVLNLIQKNFNDDFKSASIFYYREPR